MLRINCLTFTNKIKQIRESRLPSQWLVKRWELCMTHSIPMMYSTRIQKVWKNSVCFYKIKWILFKFLVYHKSSHVKTLQGTTCNKQFYGTNSISLSSILSAINQTYVSLLIILINETHGHMTAKQTVISTTINRFWYYWVLS